MSNGVENKKVDCTHTNYLPGHYDEEGKWVDGYEEWTYKDVNLHNYECTKCGAIFPYSGG